MRYLSRDPFARTIVVRTTHTGDTVDQHGGFGARLYPCEWCGTVRRTRTGKPQLYRYATEDDNGRRVAHPGAFCCKSCHDAFHA